MTKTKQQPKAQVNKLLVPLTNKIGVVFANSEDPKDLLAARVQLMSITCCGEQEKRLKQGEMCDCNCHAKAQPAS